MINNNFDFMGLYPKPISQMNRLELLFSSAITVFVILGLVTAMTIIFTETLFFLKLVGSIAFFVGGIYFLLHTLQSRSNSRKMLKEKIEYDLKKIEHVNQQKHVKFSDAKETNVR